MCGIFAVLRESSGRTAPSPEWIKSSLDNAVREVAQEDPIAAFDAAASYLDDLNTALKGAAGVEALLAGDSIGIEVEKKISLIDSRLGEVEQALDSGALTDDLNLEDLNSAMVRLKDLTWAIVRDRLRTAECVRRLANGVELNRSAICNYASIQLALSAIDRLEVRGRDSAGIAILAFNHGLNESELDEKISNRVDSLLLSGAVERSGETLAFVYKAAAAIGALGDNVSYMRQSITNDELLREILTRPETEISIISHTRWASVGTITQANASPIDSRVENKRLPLVLSALNGDVDNHAELKHAEDMVIAEDITTDVKVIPVMTASRIADGMPVVDAFRETVSTFLGSMAIATVVIDEPRRLLLALKGSGQGCYIGLSEDAYLIASEPYGLVEECSKYVRLDGESTSAISGKQGQIVELNQKNAGTLDAIRRLSFGGEELPFAAEDVIEAEVTTRDIDRADAPHFLLKEIMESPLSVKRTLRGKISEERGRLRVTLPDEALPIELQSLLKSGTIKQIIGIGQGTALVAARTVAAVMEKVAPQVPVTVKAATELSGFALRDDMSDTLIIAVSQSGTTTDTNRTVDLARSRGAKVVAIVNRRASDLAKKVDGVLYTSDGRDVEMSVASTKAFYAQVSAATLLSLAIASHMSAIDRQEMHELLTALRQLPEAMRTVLNKQDQIAEIAQKYAPSRKSWALVGNGANYIAAQEVRIKLSELCYKSIAVDVTEDKKHIDLSAEPLIIVCAAGLSGSNAADVSKEVAIYRAHKAKAISIVSEGTVFSGSDETVSVPALHPLIDFVLSAVVGHLFGYEAALAIDAQGKLMRSARAVLDDAIASDHVDGEALMATIRSEISGPAAQILEELHSGAMNGHLSTSVAVRLSALLRYAAGLYPHDIIEMELGGPHSPAQVVGELMTVLNEAVDELTRPIDAVKHQAKTVTVGISRTEDDFADVRLVAEVAAAGADRAVLSYRTMRTLAALNAGVRAVTGFTRYEIEGEVAEGTATVKVIDKGGIAVNLQSRTEVDSRLVGTKHRAAYERIVTVGRGQRDGRTVIIVPEYRDMRVSGITLLHVDFHETLPADQTKEILTGYRNRYSALVDAVTETEPDFQDEVLGEVSLIDLLVEPVWVLAENWRH